MSGTYRSGRKNGPSFSTLAFLIVLILTAALYAACSISRPSPTVGRPPEGEIREELALPAPMAQKSMMADRAGEAPAAGGTGIPASEEYKGLPENPFKLAKDEKFSTFSADVDTASYSNIRRFLNEGRLPPPEAVRIEELLNYFDYGWREPAGAEPLALSAESAASPWSDGRILLALGLRTRTVSAANLPPANLVFLVDTSGSMSDPDKLPLVKRAFSLLAETLRPQDRVSLVAYAGSAGLVLPPTPGTEKAKILAALEALESGGSTAGGQGIVLAYDTALQNFRRGGNNRVILATDGDFNVGLSSEEELVKLIESYRNRGVFLSVLGFGTGNYKDAKMEALADKGNGNFAYIDSVEEARKVLIEEMGATLLTAAKDVKLQVEFDPAVVKSWRLIGYENRVLSKEDFTDDKKDAGEMGAGHRVTALYEIEPVSSASGGGLGILRVRYKKPDQDQSAQLELALPDGRGSLANASGDLRFAAAVAAYGMILRGSEHKGRADWKLVLDLARGAAGDSDRRAEFVTLAEKASGLK